uniref:Uncharacterized protein n=1 Tax=Oryzias latipes TaxID=8090 RepID=A0A3P9HRI2_ORYLA
ATARRAAGSTSGCAKDARSLSRLMEWGVNRHLALGLKDLCEKYGRDLALLFSRENARHTPTFSVLAARGSQSTLSNIN